MCQTAVTIECCVATSALLYPRRAQIRLNRAAKNELLIRAADFAAIPRVALA